MPTKTKKPTKPSRINPSPQAKAVVQAHLKVLPSGLQTKVMQEMLLRSLYDGHFREAFRVNPRQFLDASGIQLPANVKVDVHENSEDTLHIVLPGVLLSRVSKAKVKEETSGQKQGKTVISDGDLRSGPEVGLWNDDFRNKTDGKDPRTGDRKGDGTDGTNFFQADNDYTRRAADVRDTGKD